MKLRGMPDRSQHFAGAERPPSSASGAVSATVTALERTECQQLDRGAFEPLPR